MRPDVAAPVRCVLAAIGVSTLIAPNVCAQRIALTAVLDGSQVVPPVASLGRGVASFVIDREANTLSFRVTVERLQANEVAAQLHGFAPPGTNAATLLALPLGTTKTGVWNYPESAEAQIVAGLCYAEIATAAWPAGELRGQIERDASDVSLFAAIDNSATMVNTQASGTGIFSIDTQSDGLSFDIAMAHLKGSELASHIHGVAGPVGNPILLVFPGGNFKSGAWTFAARDERDLTSGLCYVNVHTTTFGNGEINGVIVPVATNPSTYCTAKTNSLGCVPAIAASGQPNLAGLDDFHVVAVQVLNQQFAVFAWSRAPRITSAFGGTWCVAAPLVRTPIVDCAGHVGVVDCSGVAAFHFTHAYAAAHGLGAGDLVYGQWLARDPQQLDGTGVSLSNAIQFDWRP